MRTTNQNNKFVCDFETVTVKTKYYQQHNDTKVLLANSLNWASEEHHTFATIEEWWEFHLDINKKQTLFFHNLSFDGGFILPFLAKRYKLNEHKHDYGDPHSYEVFRNGGKIYYIRFYGVRRNRRYTIDMKCSYRLLNAPVEVLGEALGINKHLENEDSSFYDLEPQEDIKNYPERFIEYIKNDCLIVLLSLKNFESTLKDLEFGGYIDLSSKLTIASLSFTLMKYSLNQIYRSYHWLYITPELYMFYRQWYKGGLSQTNTKYIDSIVNKKELKNALFIDVSSAYPYHMTKYLPYGEVLTTPPSGPYVTLLEIDVKHAKLKKDHEFVTLFNWNRHKPNGNPDQRYVKELKDFKCYYYIEEWNVLNKIYDFKVKEIKYYYAKSEPFLQDYYLKVFEIKNKYTREGNLGLRQASKILLNSGTGTLAKKFNFNSYVYLNKPKYTSTYDIADNPNDALETGDTLCTNTGNYEVIRDINESFNWGDNVYGYVTNEIKPIEWAMNVNAIGYVTALERTYLMYKVLKYGCEKFLYCDTDSILLHNLTDEEYKSIINEESDELGGWTVEAKPKYFETYGAKRYVLKDEEDNIIKSRWSGNINRTSNFKKIYETLDFTRDEVEIANSTLVKKKCKSGIVLELVNKIYKRGNH